MAIAEQEQSMSLWNIQFQELYERHLCRHSQFGLNINHLVSVAGTYLALMGIVYWLSGSWWVLGAITVPYLALLVANVPFRVLVATVAFLGLLFALFSILPPIPVWVYPIMIVVFHRIQIWGHKIYTAERDMTEFNKKYKKGPFLFVLLALYELPILLNYLLFGRKDWIR